MSVETDQGEGSKPSPRRQRPLRWVLKAIVPIVLFAYGTWTFPLAMLGDERKLLPGDLGDSRFNNYILEHFHQYATGKVDSYWDAPFMYPYKNVTALSDNLLGTAPLYSLFRHFGFNRESAYQLWILALFSLNYICCFIALVLWSKRAALSACGAYVFAFGIHMIGQMEHAQVFPKFMVPLAFWFCWQWLNSGRAKHLLWTALAVVYQFYCGVYLGFMLCYGLLFLVIGFGVIDFRRLLRYRPAHWLPFAKGAGVLVLAGVVLWPLMQPYMEASEAIGMRMFDAGGTTLLSMKSYFITHPGALSWHSLALRSPSTFEGQWSHFHFMGALPWLAVLLLPFVLWRSRADATVKKASAVVGVAFALGILFRLHINVQAMYFAVLFVLVFASLATKSWAQMLLSICLPIAVIIDNRIDVHELERYDKYAAQELVDRVVLDMQLQLDSTALALAYMPARGVMPFSDDRLRSDHMHLTAMLAGQQLGITVVNAYSSSYPVCYIPFRDRQDRASLAAWCAANGTTSIGIRLANNIHRPILNTDTVRSLACNGEYLSVDPDQQGRALADTSAPGPWETFVRLQLSDDEYAFVAHTDRFLSAELHHDSALVAVSDRLGDMGVFTLQEQPDGRTAIRADNGMYMALDSASLRLVARAATVDVNCLFRFERPGK